MDYKTGFNSWGLSSVINLYGCSKSIIKNPDKIKKYIIELCEMIDMERHGDPQIERFAEGSLEGISAMQFIKTSSITLHFDEQENRAFIDIFSCKWFDAERAVSFSKLFFKAKKSQMITIERE